MTDSTARPADAAAAQTDAAATPMPEIVPGAEASGVPDAQAAAAALATLAAEANREAAEFKDKLLRTLAEMENLRRRTEREVADARLYSIAGFARDILGVADNMDRALQSLDTDLRGKTDTGVKALLDGVELTERELLKVLEKHGIRKFEPTMGEKFDANLHQAMYEVPNPSLPGGAIAQVVQAGYMISERMLRPALVAVVKNPPKPAAGEAPANDNTGASSPGSPG